MLARFLRVLDWWYYLVLPLAAMRFDPSFFRRIPLAVILVLGALAFAYGWNEWHDRGPKSFSSVSDRLLAFALACAAGLAAVAALMLGPFSIGMAAISISAAWIYSGGPRIKRFPIVCTLANGFIFVPLALAGAEGIAEVPASGWALVLAFAALLLQNQLIHERAHASADERDGIQTTVRLLGPKASAWAAVLLGILSIWPIALAVKDRPIIAAGAATMAAIATVVAWIGIRGSEAEAHFFRRIQRLLGLVAGAIAWLGAFIVPLFLL